MKKLLALVLALVMAMSLVTISNAAFDDADEISNKEAVEVMNAVGVLAGYDNGDFGPTDTLTRAQAAKIIAYLDLGKDVAEALPALQVYSDVPASHWAAKYIAYCADAGYVSGVGDGKFDPDAKVTGYQFGKMLLCVLGYDADVEQMTGANWQIAVAKLMETNELAKNVDGFASANLTREEAAQYALNALKATCVEYEDKGTIIEGNGLTITTNAKKANDVTKAHNDEGDCAYCSIDETKDGAKDIVQLGEKLYKGDLKKVEGEHDDFGRPASYAWEYDNEIVYTVYETPLFTFTAETSNKDMLKVLKNWYANSKVAANKITAEADAERYADLTANGKLVELYGDKDNKVIEFTLTCTYQVVEVTNIDTNKDGDVTYTLKGGDDILDVVDYADDDKNDDTVVLAGKVEEDDIVTAAFLVDDEDDFKIAYVYPTTKIVGTQTKATNSKLTISGETYSVGTGVLDGEGDLIEVSSFANQTKDYNYYLDQYGFVVKTSSIAETKNYAVVDLIALMNTSGTATNKYAEAKLVFADGTTDTVKVVKINGNKVKDFSNDTGDIENKKMSSDVDNNTVYLNTVVTYTVKDNEYSLTYTDVGTDPADIDLTAGVPTLTGTDVINGSTVIVVKSGDSDSKAEFKAYTGYKAMPNVSGSATISYAKNDDGDVVFVYADAVGATVSGKNTTVDVFYAVSDDVTVTGTSSDDDIVYSLTGIFNGEEATIQSESKFFDEEGLNMTKGEMYKLTIDSDGYVTAVTAQGDDDTDYVKGTVTKAAKNGLLVTSTGTYTYDGEETVVVIDEDGELVSGGITKASADDVVYIKVVDASGSDDEKIAIDTIYIILK